MRRAIVLLMTSVLILGISAPSTLAVPTDSKIIVAAKARFLTPTTLLVEVTYVCPESAGPGSLSVVVSQEETGGIGSGLDAVPCTGDREAAVVTVGGADFNVGQALAQGQISGLFFPDTHQRRIQIVL